MEKLDKNEYDKHEIPNRKTYDNFSDHKNKTTNCKVFVWSLLLNLKILKKFTVIGCL